MKKIAILLLLIPCLSACTIKTELMDNQQAKPSVYKEAIDRAEDVGKKAEEINLINEEMINN